MTDIDTRIGTVDLPDRMDRERYIRELTYLELSLLFAGPVKPSVLAKWKATDDFAIGLVAPWVMTHKTPPKASKLWAHDATVGEFRDSGPARVARAELAKAVAEIGASHVVFRSPPLFAASAKNRETLTAFFTELATEDEIGGATRVWVPDGLWDPITAITFANEIGVTCAFDPLVRDPGQPPEIYYDLEVSELYLRISGLGRSGPLRNERQEDLAMLIESYEDVPVTVAFDSPQRWQDARNFKKLLSTET